MKFIPNRTAPFVTGQKPLLKKVNPFRELCSLTTIDGGIEPPSLRNDLYHRQESVAFSNGVKVKRPVTISEIDISKDPLLFEKYKEKIPSVFINGKLAFVYKVHEITLKKKLNVLCKQKIF